MKSPSILVLSAALVAFLSSGCGNDRSRGLPPTVDSGAGDSGGGDGGGDGGDASPECDVDADCEALTGGCAAAACVGGACELSGAVPDGTSCDDEDACTSDDFCTAGRCGGTRTDCSAFDDGVCMVGMCDSSTGECAAVPVSDGTGCDDGAVCSDGDSCVAGSCVPGDTLDCSAFTDLCNVGMCDEMAGGCVQLPLADGVGCDDGDACTVGDQCVAGTCTSSPLDCTGLDDMCNVGMCDATSGFCVATPVVDGSACDDGNACTRVDRCAAGTCGGSAPVDCSGFMDQCNTGVCDSATGTCSSVPVLDGTTCDDGDAVCTPGVDTCTAGACGGPDICCGASDFQLNEMHGNSPDFIELINTGTCTLDANIVSLRFRGACDTAALSYTFPVGTMVAPGGLIRLVDTTAPRAGEIYFGDNICHYEDQPGWAMLCEGPCSVSSCANTLDYFEQTDTTGVRPPGYPSCATFTPGPLNVNFATTSQSSARVSFVGGGAAGRQSDWAIRTMTR